MNIANALSRGLLMPACRAYARYIVRDKPADATFCQLCAIRFWIAHHYWPRFRQPTTFAEKIWHRMLFDRNPLWTVLSDKLKVRDYLAAKIGREHLVPLLWSSNDPDLLPFDQLPASFVIKATHGCGYNIIVHDKSKTNPDQVKGQLKAWLRQNYGRDTYVGVEWGYIHIEPAVIVEKFIGKGGKAPTDYKFFCYSGRAEFIQVDFDRFENHTEQFFDRDFNRLDFELGMAQYSGSTQRPADFNELLCVAEAAAQGLDFIRVDLYYVDGQIYVGELTCYPSGGASRFTPRKYDYLLGDKWQSKKALQYPLRCTSPVHWSGCQLSEAIDLTMHTQVLQPNHQSAEAERQRLHSCVTTLLRYCRAHDWAGHDPYDALNSRLLRGLGLLGSHYPRLAVTQFLKRCPINLRGLLGVPREQNPKGIAVFLAATVRLHRVGQASAAQVRELAARLLELRSPNQKLPCWGYNFDWQTRTYLVPKFTPNIICSTFAANALLDAYEVVAEPAWLEAALGVGEFLLTGLNTTRDGDTLCFSYTPLDRGQIHNASLLGAAVLARLHAHRASEVFRSAAVAATRFSLARQRPDGSWPYGESAKQKWIDGFHTGYNLMALERVRRSVDWPELRVPIERGYRFYLDYFFEPDGRAKYFHNRTWPIDAHSVAQALITLNALAEYDPRSQQVAGNVCRWALQNMRAPGGWFYYQKWPLWTNRISYMRWTQSWMLLGLATMQEALSAGSPASAGSTGAR